MVLVCIKVRKNIELKFQFDSWSCFSDPFNVLYVIKGQGMYGHVEVEKLQIYHFLIPVALL